MCAQAVEQTIFSAFFTPVRALTGPSVSQGSSLDPNGPQSLPQESAFHNGLVEMGEAKRKFRLNKVFARSKG